jgi:hypothetical protein
MPLNNMLRTIFDACHGSSVNIVSAYELDDRGSIPGKDRDFLFIIMPRAALLTTVTSDYWGLCPQWMKLAEHEADHSPPSPTQWLPEFFLWRLKQLERETDQQPQPRSQVKNMWSYTSTPPFVFMAC